MSYNVENVIVKTKIILESKYVQKCTNMYRLSTVSFKNDFLQVI